MKRKKTQRLQASRVQLYRSGPDYLKAWLELIESSEQTIHIQVYILELDRSGSLLVESLVAASQRGVSVYCLLDAYGSQNVEREDVAILESRGLNVYFFNSLLSFTGQGFSRRIHQKVLISDRRAAILGGINMADEYLTNRSDRPWLDFGVQVEGPIVDPILEYCEQVFCSSVNKKTLHPSKGQIEVKSEENVNCKFNVNDIFRKRLEISKELTQRIRKAETQINLMNSYFFPRKKLLKLLVASAKRGVRTRVVFPQKSDIPWLKYATDHLYSVLLCSDIEIYEWTKTILHAKTISVDENWCSIGSYNMNLTAYANMEMNLSFYDRKVTQKFNSQFESIINEGCVLISLADIQAYSVWRRGRNRLAYYLFKMLGSVYMFFQR